jgi:hypothetical protein
MLFLDSTVNVKPITDLILTWTHIGQALVDSIGALAPARPCAKGSPLVAGLYRST